MKKILCFLLSAVLAAGMLAGCDTGADTPYVPTGGGLTWDQEDYTGPTTAQTGQESTQALSLICYPDLSMNPYLCTDFTNRALFPLIYQGLFTVSRDYQVEPMLCKSYRRSEDMRSYTFYLENATFSDGSRLTAADVVASLEAARESQYYGGRFFFINQISLSSDGGVTVLLDAAMENLPVLLDIPILREDQLTADRPLGTGPYALETTATGLRLRQRTNWWCSAELPVTAPAITLIKAESNTQIRDEFEFGDLGLACADPGSDKYVDFRCDFELWDCENGIFLYLGFNMESELFSNAALRKAVTYAIDRETIVADHYRGFARSANLPISPLSPYYSSKLASNYGYDSAKFAEAVGTVYQSEPAVLVVNSDDSLRLRVARAVCEMLEAGGLKVELQAVKTSTYKYLIETRQFDLYLGQTKLSPNMDLATFFSTSGDLCYGAMADVTTYALCKEALANHGNYFTLHQKIMEEGLLCPILFRSYAVYATRSLFTDLNPARDNIFYYSLGKTMETAHLTSG